MTMKWKIGWGLSNRCNMRCSFCYSKKVRQEPDYENNIKKGVEFILRNKDKIDSINFGTGEPTICPEMFTICDVIKREAPHISIGITTNGTLASAVADPVKMEIFERCIDDVDISLDYGNKEEQDRSRGFDGAFDLALRALELCQNKGKNASVVNALHKENCTIENLDSLVRIARIYGASFRVNIYRPTVNFDFILTYDELKDAFIHLVNNYEIESIADPMLAALIGVPCPYGDPVGKCSFRLLPNGFITPSTYLINEDWRAIRIDEIDDIDSLHDYEQFTRIINQEIPKECDTCSKKSVCQGGVIDRRWLWYGSLDKKDPYCPYDNDDTTDWRDSCKNIVISSSKKSFVHDGYLPTLIFGSAINESSLNVWDKIYLDPSNAYQDTKPVKLAVTLNEYLSQGARVADLGCGLGRNGLYLLEKDKEVCFVDDSRIACDAIFRACASKEVFSGYSIKDMSVDEYLSKEKADALDGALAIHVLSHGTPAEISDTIHAIDRVLRDGAFLALTLPSTDDRRLTEQQKKNSAIQEKHDALYFALEDGPEKGIVHSFYTESALHKLLRGFSIRYLEEEKDSKGNAHWNLIVVKKG